MIPCLISITAAITLQINKTYKFFFTALKSDAIFFLKEYKIYNNGFCTNFCLIMRAPQNVGFCLIKSKDINKTAFA